VLHRDAELQCQVLLLALYLQRVEPLDVEKPRDPTKSVKRAVTARRPPPLVATIGAPAAGSTDMATLCS
jgi:hypothetical protein